ncbi:hypothetical protein G6O69_04915 [Pseudenhygromyxa sp. WMMC2535]|uniref:hypothetical protein n=1 Tax=Pseudenhygromyxa sp. WMMC2535 TaxID=2712867 RepID=UPI00155830B9|nr:hypothetical protein [Pseudenhygromyxa sp. WMMC2535]NVB37161.1 hypothetical protein [Pseudenhygromyxa sp. WMMC2535]
MLATSLPGVGCRKPEAPADADGQTQAGDPQLRSVREQLAAAEALAREGDPRGAAAKLDALDANAEVQATLADEEKGPELRAEIAMTRARLALARGHADASEHLQAAVDAAIAAEHPELLIDARLALAHEIARFDPSAERASRLLAQAEAAIETSASVPLTKQLERARLRGDTASMLGRDEDAMAVLDAGLERARGAEETEGAPALAALARTRAQALVRRREPGDLQRAADDLELAAKTLADAKLEGADITLAQAELALEREQLEPAKTELDALDAALAALGPDAPPALTVGAALARARLLLARGDAPAAKAQAEAALEQCDTRDDPPIFACLHAHERLAAAAFAMSDHALAEQTLRAAIIEAKGLYGERGAPLGVLYTRHGEALLGLGRLDDAEADFDLGLSILESSRADSEALFDTVLGKGKVLLARDEPRGAVLWLERATSTSSAASPEVLAELAWALARAQLGAGAAKGREDRAPETAKKALERYRDLGPEYADEVAEIEAWLAAL